MSNTAWPRANHTPTAENASLFFVCFAKKPLSDVPLDLQAWGLPDVALLKELRVAEHERVRARAWFEGWWADSFGVHAERDLAEALPLLLESNVCATLSLDVPDRADHAAIQTIWGVARWLCERGASVVLDVTTLQFRTAAQVQALDHGSLDVAREVRVVFENQTLDRPEHVLHTRGLEKFARPDLLAFITSEDLPLIGAVMSQLATLLVEGELPQNLQFRLKSGVELTTASARDLELVEALGLKSALELVRQDERPLAGLADELRR